MIPGLKRSRRLSNVSQYRLKELTPEKPQQSFIHSACASISRAHAHVLRARITGASIARLLLGAAKDRGLVRCRGSSVSAISEFAQ
jgi:hypothetical protein